MSEREYTPADSVMASALVEAVGRLLTDMATLAAEIGTTVNVGQVLGATLAMAYGMTDQPISRQEYERVWEVYEKHKSIHADVTDFGAGPEAAAGAATHHEAVQIADHWGEVIETAAFDLSFSPEGLAEWEREMLNGGSDG